VTVELSLARCKVRTLEVGDANSLAQHANDKRIWAQLRDRFPHPYTTADATAFIGLILREGPLASMSTASAASALSVLRMCTDSPTHRRTRLLAPG